MNISGTVRIDLSGYVEHQYLALRDRDIRDVLRGVSGGRCAYVIDVGDATDIVWDRRLVEALAGASSVTVEGCFGEAVEHAVAELHELLLVPAPRRAS